MRFVIRKRRNTPTIIIVALVDVLIVLLIFLMVTTTFKQQQSLRMSLPESSQAQKEGANDTHKTLIVNIDPAGVYSVGRDKAAKTFEQLEAELRAAVEKDPQLVLAINADEKAPWGKIVKLRDAAAAAKVKSLVAFTKDAPKP
jgi:biopolymer transport protein ExbD